MRVRVSTHKCIVSGLCAQTCSEVFTQNDDGVVHVLDEHPPLVLSKKIQQAALLCPAQAFLIEDQENTTDLIILEDDWDQ
jgi:ferredoxin